jgi:sulfopyruvate decarboxylase subunit alpha
VCSDAARLNEQIHEAGIRLVASLPDDWMAPVIRSIDADDRFIHVPTAREAEIVGICAGSFFAGVDALAVMGMAGVLAIVHEVATLNLMHDIPLLILSSWRGQPDEAPHTVYQVVQGRVGEPVMDALGIHHESVPRWADLDIATALRHTRKTKRPVVLSLSRELALDLSGEGLT